MKVTRVLTRSCVAVDGDKLAHRNLLLHLAVPSLYRKRLTKAHLREYLAKTVFGQGENDRDGLKLRNHYKRVRGVGRHQVAGADQAQTHAFIKR